MFGTSLAIERRVSRPRRIDGFSYVGFERYFLTICTRDRREVFRDDTVVATTLCHVRRIAAEERFTVLAYCLMPDHAHFLVEGQSEGSDFCRFVKRAKQHSGAAYAVRCKQPLWQEGYHERVLRRETDAREVARYLLWNPVRAGLVPSPAEYPYLGSDVWSVQELLESC
jgi:REP element-mobilizing transposase RayT